ncbi:hypothetical protein FB107DRAFT_211056 [Schizophyllum commune]
MAFQVPSHLPRRAAPQDVTSAILTKMDEATVKTLDAAQARVWLGDLDETIAATRRRIHDRIHKDLPEFQRQLETSRAVQQRLKTLSENVNDLDDGISNPETGLLPTLVRKLTAHSALAQEASDAAVNWEAISHLTKSRDHLRVLEALLNAGKLPAAVTATGVLDELLNKGPTYLNDTDIIKTLRRALSQAKTRLDDQLNDAYSRSIVVSPTQITVRPSVQVRKSDQILSLQDVVSSLSPTARAEHLSLLRRDLTAHYIERVLSQDVDIDVTSTPDEVTLRATPAPPDGASLPARLHNIATVLEFCNTHIFSALLPSSGPSFERTLCKPLTDNVLNNLLIPSLPNSFDQLPPFLDLAKLAARFEQEWIIGKLGSDAHDRRIQSWADGVVGHYERQRRLDILERCRVLLVADESTFETFKWETTDAQPAEVVPVQQPEDEPQQDEAWGFDNAEDAWGLDEEAKEADADGWGLEDDAEPTQDEAPAPVNGKSHPVEPEASADTGDGWGLDDDAPGPDEPPPDAEDAWGLNDDSGSAGADDSAWDDPWAEPAPDPEPQPAPIPSPAKPATRLEKLAAKGKKKEKEREQEPSSGSSFSSPPSSFSSSLLSSSPSPPLGSSSNVTPSTSTAPLSTSTATPSISISPPTTKLKNRPSQLRVPEPPKETCLVSTRATQVLDLVRVVLDEWREFAASEVVTSTTPSSTSSTSGTILLQSSASILDLFRALYPVKFSETLAVPDAGMRFANGCLYLSRELARIPPPEVVRDRWAECIQRLKVLNESWYYDVIETQRRAVDTVLTTGAQGFTLTGDQDRYDECEAAMSEVLSDIRRLAARWQGVLAKSKYYTALGLVIDAALSRVLADVLALPDIPEVESHRLSELCRILNSLEGLFVEDAAQPSFIVAYVPSWLKFSYLSELLEASMADITYLFETGALVDFSVDELVRLVQALFADTALRATTIHKIQEGHPSAAVPEL